MYAENEYGWFSDIEANPDVIYIEYKHIAAKGIYRVRNVHVEFPSPPIEISLTGENLRKYSPESTETRTYDISQTHYIDVPHIIYINEKPDNQEDTPPPENKHHKIAWYNTCIQNTLYILTACAIVLVCWG